MNNCNNDILKIFLVFIKNKTKSKTIKELEVLKKEGYLKGDMNRFYKDFKPFIIYFSLITLYIHHNPKKNTKSKKNKRSMKHDFKKYSYKKMNTVGGRKSLFALIDKGKEPITGDDFKDWLDRLTEVSQQLYYTQYAQDPTVEQSEGQGGELNVNISNPYVATLTVLGALRKDPYSIATNQGSNILKIIRDPTQLIFNFREFYNIYKMYTKDYILSEEIANPELKKQRLMRAALKKGRPKDPSFLSGIQDLFEIKNEELNSNNNGLYKTRTGPRIA